MCACVRVCSCGVYSICVVCMHICIHIHEHVYIGTLVEVKQDDGAWLKGTLVGRPSKLKYTISFGPKDELELGLPNPQCRVLPPQP